jgi:ABC-type glutathione transport system ATPase component
MTPLLQFRLSADYSGKPDLLRDAALEVAEGEILGLVGASGSGKSTLALALLRLLEYRGGVARGEILFRGRDLMRLKSGEMQRVRGREIALIPQSPLAALNPALRLRAQIAEAWRAHETGKEWKTRTLGIFERVSLPATEEFLARYPRQLSVGQAQRVLIAMALLHRPTLLIADEPTSALDALAHSEVLDLLKSLSRELGVAMLYISHDLPAIAWLCDRLAILHQGSIVETGPAKELFENPRHEYTRALLSALRRHPFAHERESLAAGA